MPLRIIALLLAVIAVYFLGRAAYDLLVLRVVPWLALLFGVSAAVGATGLFHEGLRHPSSRDD